MKQIKTHESGLIRVPDNRAGIEIFSAATINHKAMLDRLSAQTNILKSTPSNTDRLIDTISILPKQNTGIYSH
jgi:hypothetical protein